MQHLIDLQNIYKNYPMGTEQVNALDGISLTVAKAGREQFSVSTIPHTVAQTNLHSRKKGDTVNLETDVMAKYIERLLTAVPQPKQEGITREFLLQSGF